MHLLRSRGPAWTLAGATLLSGLLGATAVVAGTAHSPEFGGTNLADPNWAGADLAPTAPPATEPAGQAAGRPAGSAAVRRIGGPALPDHTLIRPHSTRSVTTTPPVVVPPDDLAAAQAPARTACRLTLVSDRSPYSDRSACPNS